MKSLTVRFSSSLFSHVRCHLHRPMLTAVLNEKKNAFFAPNIYRSEECSTKTEENNEAYILRSVIFCVTFYFFRKLEWTVGVHFRNLKSYKRIRRLLRSVISYYKRSVLSPEFISVPVCKCPGCMKVEG